jgi:hypothetical protein
MAVSAAAHIDKALPLARLRNAVPSCENLLYDIAVFLSLSMAVLTLFLARGNRLKNVRAVFQSRPSF